jgi:arginyl-tRNA synthetase
MEESIDKIIKVTSATREKLKRGGSKGDTYEDVITQMFAELEEDREFGALDESKLEDLVKKLAALEHDQWMAWSRSIAKSNEPIEERDAQWEKLWVSYVDLPAEEKKADRYWVRKIIKLLEKEGIIVLRGRGT